MKVTGYQWMWEYEYVDQGLTFTSRLDRESDRLRQNSASTAAELAAKEHYLRDVDHPLVLPANTRIRFVITADDVIHAWWVPALGWKQDAIPGVINEAWTEVATPGTYRGVCAELCGKDHGFMLSVIWLRCLKGHFSKDHHFAFEAVAWYWHFVDVVWLGLFLFVYVL